jgi:hypothetical protein
MEQGYSIDDSTPNLLGSGASQGPTADQLFVRGRLHLDSLLNQSVEQFAPGSGGSPAEAAFAGQDRSTFRSFLNSPHAPHSPPSFSLCPSPRPPSRFKFQVSSFKFHFSLCAFAALRLCVKSPQPQIVNRKSQIVYSPASPVTFPHQFHRLQCPSAPAVPGDW